MENSSNFNRLVMVGAFFTAAAAIDTCEAAVVRRLTADVHLEVETKTTVVSPKNPEEIKEVQEKVAAELQAQLLEGLIDFEPETKTWVSGMVALDLLNMPPEDAQHWLAANKERQRRIKSLAEKNRIGVDAARYLKASEPSAAIEMMMAFETSEEGFFRTIDPDFPGEEIIITGAALRFFNACEKSNSEFFTNWLEEQAKKRREKGIRL